MAFAVDPPQWRIYLRPLSVEHQHDASLKATGLQSGPLAFLRFVVVLPFRLSLLRRQANWRNRRPRNPNPPTSPATARQWLYCKDLISSSIPRSDSAMSSSTVALANSWAPLLSVGRQRSVCAQTKLSGVLWKVRRRIACACSAPPCNSRNGHPATESSVSS